MVSLAYHSDTCADHQAAPKYNYEAICAIYLVSLPSRSSLPADTQFASIGLGGNIPIDATIALEFLPQNRRNLVSLLSMWQPIGVIFACAVALGTTAKYRCTAGLPGCNTVADGVSCCRVEDNMGWRYNIIIISLITLLIFFLRYFIFTFHESPKFLLSRGREQDAIDVLHKIAKFNKQPPPTLTLQHFRELEQAETQISGTTFAENDPVEAEITAAAHAKLVTKRALTSITHLKALFTNKLQLFIFILFAVTYMGDYWSFNLAGAFLPIVLLQNNVSTGRGTVLETYRQYIYIALPGILGAALALLSVSLPLFGRKWSLVFSAAMQGLSMAMYTQVKTTVGYVGLNAMEYLMQTVSYFSLIIHSVFLSLHVPLGRVRYSISQSPLCSLFYFNLSHLPTPILPSTLLLILLQFPLCHCSSLYFCPLPILLPPRRYQC